LEYTDRIAGVLQAKHSAGISYSVQVDNNLFCNFIPDYFLFNFRTYIYYNHFLLFFIPDYLLVCA